MLRPQPPYDVVPVEGRQHDVQDDDVICSLARLPVPLHAVVHDIDTEPLGHQPGEQHVRQPHIVLDHQYPHPNYGGTSP